jgi:hypothetical protein
MDQPPVDRLLASIFPPAQADAGPPPSVYAVLDGARDERIARAVYDSRLEYECLFTGEISHDLSLAAPYLVQLDAGAAFTRWLLAEGWRKSFGIFAWTRADIETMRRHCRRLLQIKDEDGRRLFFRYYDPRVLRVFLPTCTVAELREVFGPVERLVAEGAEGQLIAYESGGRPLRTIEARVV